MNMDIDVMYEINRLTLFCGFARNGISEKPRKIYRCLLPPSVDFLLHLKSVTVINPG